MQKRKAVQRGEEMPTFDATARGSGGSVTPSHGTATSPLSESFSAAPSPLSASEEAARRLEGVTMRVASAGLPHEGALAHFAVGVDLLQARETILLGAAALRENEELRDLLQTIIEWRGVRECFAPDDSLGSIIARARRSLGADGEETRT